LRRVKNAKFSQKALSGANGTPALLVILKGLYEPQILPGALVMVWRAKANSETGQLVIQF